MLKRKTKALERSDLSRKERNMSVHCYPNKITSYKNHTSVKRKQQRVAGPPPWNVSKHWPKKHTHAHPFAHSFMFTTVCRLGRGAKIGAATAKVLRRPSALNKLQTAAAKRELLFTGTTYRVRSCFYLKIAPQQQPCALTKFEGSHTRCRDAATTVWFFRRNVLLFFLDTYLSLTVCYNLGFFRWDISFICLVIVSKLTKTVFTSLPFRKWWPNWHKFFRSFQKNRSVTAKKTQATTVLHLIAAWRPVTLASHSVIAIEWVMRPGAVNAH